MDISIVLVVIYLIIAAIVAAMWAVISVRETAQAWRRGDRKVTDVIAYAILLTVGVFLGLVWPLTLASVLGTLLYDRHQR